MPFQQMPELEQRGGIGHRLNTQVDPRKCAHRLTVIDRVFKTFVSHRMPLLQKVDAQHPLYAYRRPPTLAARIVRLDQLHQSPPRNHSLPPSPKTFPPGGFFFFPVFGLRETELVFHAAHRSKPTVVCPLWHYTF